MYNCIEEMIPFIPNHGVTTEDSNLRNTHTRNQGYPSQFKPYMSPSSDRGLQRGNSYSPPSSSIKAIVDFHPPADLRNSSESLEKMQCSADHEPPNQFHNPTQQIHPENFESIHELLIFPHDTTDESIKFTGDEQDLTEELISGTLITGPEYHSSIFPGIQRRNVLSLETSGCSV